MDRTLTFLHTSPAHIQTFRAYWPSLRLRSQAATWWMRAC